MVALLAAFAYGPGIGLGIASVIVNVVHILFLSPLLWATQGVLELGAEASGDQIVFVPWILIGVQTTAFVMVLVLNRRFPGQPASGPVAAAGS